MVEKLLNVREAARILGISEKEIIELVEEGLIPAYKIANTHLRFKQDQLQELRPRLKSVLEKSHKKVIFQDNNYSVRERFLDFLYYNDFYLISLAVIIAILLLFFR